MMKGCCHRMSVFAVFVCVLVVLTIAEGDEEGGIDCCAVRHVRARQPRFCGFAADALMCSADGAGTECRTINNFGIGVGAGFSRDYVALAQEDAGCVDQLLAFHCAQRCGDCVRDNSSATFVRRRACLEFVLFFSLKTAIIVSPVKSLFFPDVSEHVKPCAPRAQRSQPTLCTTRPSCATAASSSHAPAVSASTSLQPTQNTPLSPWASSVSGSSSSSSSLFLPLLQIAMLGILIKLIKTCCHVFWV